MSEEINAYLTRAMGKCWHEFAPGYNLSGWTADGRLKICIHCKDAWAPDWVETLDADLFTWAGFGVLWEWAEQQEWWELFVLKQSFLNPMTNGTIHPTNFAKAVYNFLKEREDESKVL